MRRLRVLGGVPLAILASTASAQRSDPPPQPSEEPALTILNEGGSATSDAERLVFIDRALAMLLQPTPFRGTILCTRGALLESMDRRQEARAAFDQCRQLRPDDPRVLMAIAFDDAQDKRPMDSARLIMRAVTIDSHAADRVDPSSMDSVVRQLRYARQDALANDLLSTLATSGYARLNPAAFSDAAFVAVLSRVQQGNVEGAVQMLPSVIAPQPGVKMLIDRQFAPIWPSVEQWAGGDLSTQRKALLDGARSRYEATPTPASRVAYAVALVDTGHRQQGVALLEEWLSDPSDFDPDPWYRNSAVVKLGRWLGEAGRRADGIRRMQAAMSGPAGHDPGAVNIVPNLVVQQLLAHDYAGATATLDRHTPATDGLETPAAVGYFVALRACADEGVGRHDVALTESRRVRSVYASVDGAVTLALGCIGSSDEQAGYWLARVEDPTRRSAALLDLARARYRKQYALPLNSLEDAMMRSLSERSDVQQAYAQFGREVPSAYQSALDDFNDPILPQPAAVPPSSS